LISGPPRPGEPVETGLLGRLDARELGQSAAERVELDELGLHLAELDRHGIDVLPHELLAARDFFVARSRYQFIDEWKFPLARVLERDERKRRREGKNEEGKGEQRTGEMPRADGDRSGGCKTVGNKNNLHIRSLVLMPWLPDTCTPISPHRTAWPSSRCTRNR
jgi:hypothetical protein